MSYNISGGSNNTQNKRIQDLIEISQNESYWNFYDEKLIDSDIEFIANELKQGYKNCQVLDLFKNKITSKGVLYVSEMLKVNGTIRILNLRWNQIDDDGAKTLFDVLKDGNRTLERLHLDLNQITDKSVESILEMINTNRTLTLLILTDNQISDNNQRQLEKAVSILLRRIREWLTKLIKLIGNFNLFESVPPSTNEYDLQIQRISTRLFIILLIFLFTILFIYNSLSNITITIEIKEPNLEKYSQLYLTYSDSLTCPCTTTSINYNKLFHIDYTFHQVCNSIFISEDWFNFIRRYSYPEWLPFDNFIYSSTAQFQALNMFCQLANQTISNSLIQFNSTQYVSASVTAPHIFKLQSQALINQFQDLAKTNFLPTIHMMRYITQANGLYSGLRTNYGLKALSYMGNIDVYPQVYGNCSCDYSTRCVYQTLIYRVENELVISYVPGLLLGCYIIDGMLQSTLECFYNETCITKILSHYDDTPSINIIPLNSSLSTQYFVNSTVQDLVNNLMIEQWNLSTTYENYYNRCQPIECTYTYQSKNGVIYIITALLGLMGGLITILKLIVPVLVKFIGEMKRRRIEHEDNINISLLSKSKNYMIKLNLFSSIPPSTIEYDLENERMSTRIFIILLIISFTILLLYNSLINITITMNKKQPTFEQYLQLYEIYPQTLICPCTEISINYKECVQVDYKLHQVCTSVFVTEEWFKFLSYTFQDNNIHYDDFRWIGQALFQALHTFCQLADQTISYGLIQFYSNQYISATVTSSDLFKLQTKTSMDQSLALATTNFLLSLNIIRNTTVANAQLSARKTNYHFLIGYGGFGNTFETSNMTCNDGILNKNSLQVSIYDYPNHTMLFDMPGLYIACYPIDGMLQSTLECFYNQTCITEILSYYDDTPSMNITSLNSSLSTQYFVNSTVQDLVNNLMIEQWNLSTTYENYYNQCQPIECTYTYQNKNGVIYIITALLGLMGGLITILKLIVPVLVKFIRKIRRQQRQILISELDTNNNKQFSDYWKKIKHFIGTFNLFPSVPPSINKFDLRKELISTRIFIFLLSFSLIILLLYNSLIKIEMTIKKENPTVEQYLQLYEKYSQTLTCPCTKISINYKEFLEINYTLHQVCTSVFITEEWILYLNTISLYQPLYQDDFLLLGDSTFKALYTLCEMSHRTISNSLTQFYSNKYISAFITSKDTFLLGIKPLIDQFKSSTINNFLLSFDLIRNTMTVNQIMSASLSNYYFVGPYMDDSIIPQDQSYYGCNCAMSSKCITQFPVKSHPMMEAGYFIPGFYYGCYIIEGLLQSTLECFYDEICINRIQSYITYISPMNITLLNSSLSTQYFVTSTIQDLLNNLMIEQWNSSITYDNYYNQCQPNQCTYTYTTKNTAISIITILFGLVGGLVTVLKLVVPRLINFIAWIIKRRRQRIIPQISTIHN